MQLFGLCIIITVACLWGFLGPLFRLLLEHGVSPEEIAFWRVCISALCFFGHSLFLKTKELPRVSHLFFIIFIGMLSCGVYNVSYGFSVLQIGASMSGVLLYTAPFWVVIFARMLFREPLNYQRLLALGIAFIGIVSICFSGSSIAGQKLSFPGIAAGALSGFLYALIFPFTLVFTRFYSSVTLFSWFFLGGTCLLLPFVDFTPKTLDTYLLLCLLGFGTTYLPYLLYAKGIQLLGSVKTVVIVNLEPVIGIALAWLFFGEFFTPLGWLGTSLIIIAVFILTIEPQKITLAPNKTQTQ